MSVLPLTTERLALRLMRPTDAAALAAYRNDPAVARYQGWSLPYTEDMAAEMLRSMAHLDDVTADEWVQIAMVHEETIVGDVAVGLTGREVATIGYTLAPVHQGRGFASEAVAAIVDALFAHTDVHRIQADTDPRNHASMRVIEPLGFTYEGVARRATRVGGEWLDDLRFSLLREERAAWKAPRSRVERVELAEITEDLLPHVRALSTAHHQRVFVAPVDQSLAQALVPPADNGAPVRPWFRAVLADGEVVGFVMATEVTEAHPTPYLWRLLVDRHHQRRGIGERVVEAVADRFRAMGHRELLVSWTDAPGGPAPFYVRLGFVPTGEIEDGEVVARLDL